MSYFHERLQDSGFRIKKQVQSPSSQGDLYCNQSHHNLNHQKCLSSSHEDDDNDDADDDDDDGGGVQNKSQETENQMMCWDFLQLITIITYLYGGSGRPGRKSIFHLQMHY